MEKKEFLQLSRFAVLRRDGKRLIIEQPVGGFSYPITHPAILNIVFHFVNPANPAELFNNQPVSKRDALLKLISILREKSILVESGNEKFTDYNPEDLWQLHDLYFHTQSRSGSNLSRIGGTYRFGKENHPESYLRKKMWNGKKIILNETTVSRNENNLSLFDALKNRTSSYKVSELNLDVLSNLLANSLKIKEIRNSTEYSFVKKFHPSGGALHSIETYLAIFNCSGLAKGFYYYNSLEHCLIKIPNQKKFLASIVKNAQFSMGKDILPSALMIFSSRFNRVFWKYESLGYRLILIELGTIYQTLYLLAAALNLSVCALGNGNSSEFSESLKLNYFEETSIGEFAINGMD